MAALSGIGRFNLLQAEALATALVGNERTTFNGRSGR
jgi:hypothetical protein